MNNKDTVDAYLDLQYSLRQQELVSEIALGMNTLEDFSVRIGRALQLTGEHTGVSRVYVFEDSADGKLSDNTYEWCNEGIEPMREQLQGFPYDSIPSWKKMLIDDGLVYSEDVNRLPVDLQEPLELQSIQSIIAYPLYVQQQFFGFIGFDECVRKKAWSCQELELLRTVSGIIASSYERKLMESSLRRERDRANAANHAKTQFLTHMSHEIRSPMNTVLGFSEVLLKELPDGEQRNMVRSIITGGTMLLSLLNDLLDLSKIEAGKIAFAPKPVSMLPMLEELGLLFRLQAEKRGVAFIVSVSDTVPGVVVFDEVRVKQVIFNLVGNAIKFTSEGEVGLTVDYFGGEMSVEQHEYNTTGLLQIKVSDTGIGIPVRDLELIFEPFMQSAGVAGDRFGGTGLGLPICKRLVKQMGGTIGVESQVGEGAVFTVLIPCSEGE